MFFDIFVSLCQKKGVTPVQVRKVLGISQSTMASWKSRGLTPNSITLAKLADYFDVPMAYLLGKTPHPQDFAADAVSAEALNAANGDLPLAMDYQKFLDDEEHYWNVQREFADARIKKVTDSMNQMNEEGQLKLIDIADDMVQSGKYIKSGSSDMGKKKA